MAWLVKWRRRISCVRLSSQIIKKVNENHKSNKEKATFCYKNHVPRASRLRTAIKKEKKHFNDMKQTRDGESIKFAFCHKLKFKHSVADLFFKKWRKTFLLEAFGFSGESKTPAGASTLVEWKIYFFFIDNFTALFFFVSLVWTLWHKLLTSGSGGQVVNVPAWVVKIEKVAVIMSSTFWVFNSARHGALSI